MPNITSLRFFLAILVVIYHIPQFCLNRGFPYFDDLAVFQRGPEAVCVFFALSGFLIIRLLYIEKEKTNTISLKLFYQRRILRIFPLYYAVLIFGLFYYYFLLEKLGFEYESGCDLKTSILLGGTFFANVLITKNPGGIIEILWSIGIEEQFYIFIAPLLLLIPKPKITVFLLLFSGIYFAAYNFLKDLPLSKYHMMYFYFSAGGFFSILSYQGKLKMPNILSILIIVTFVLYFVTPLADFINSVAVSHLFKMLLFSLILCALVQKPYPIMENRVFKYLGEISYGIYALHPIVIQLVGFVFLKFIVQMNLNPVCFIIAFNMAVVLLTILAAHISYKYFERYFLKMKKRSFSIG